MGKMSAYAAAVALKHRISTGLKYYSVGLDILTKRNYELVVKELESFLPFVERMDSSSRKTMSPWLVGIAEEICTAEELFSYRGYIYIERAKRLVDSLRKTKEAYYSMVGDESWSSRSKSEMVGLRDERSRLKDMVVGFMWGEYICTIFGMAGIGKTTLAREIFQDLDILEWFDCRAWVTVGTEWNSEQVTRAILSQTGYQEETVDLKEWLEGKRYLIVLDNIWSFSIDEDMKSYLVGSFPDNKNGNRILITCRFNISYSSPFFPCHHFEKRLLDKEESWHLLRERVFDGGSCPLQLVEAGKKIADKCDGLPLTIVTVADLLSKAEETPETLWIKVAEWKKHEIFVDAYDQISKVLYSSFQEILDDEIKPCFLYMGVFPLKYEITATRLTNLWIAEEVVVPSMTPSSDTSLESLAAIILQFLDLNCLIMVPLISTSSTSFYVHPKVKTCRLHSSWWHFCQREARKTNFFYALDCYNDGVEEVIQCQTRLSFRNNVLFALKDVYSSIEENCASTAQSLLCFGSYLQYMVPICFGLKLLVRLDALTIHLYYFPVEVFELVRLRYLALTCNGQLPPSVSKLRKLEYLIVHHHSIIKSCGVESNLPMEIWDMETLKHLQVEGSDLPDVGDVYLHNLSTLLDVSTGSCTALERVPNLKKLGIKIELRPGGSDHPLRCFDHISHLTNLESLKCVVVNPAWKFEVVSPVTSFRCLPFLLKKLNLSGMGYPWEEISSIASLPNLEILKLRCNAFRGPKWKVDKNGFQKLRHLLMEGIDLVTLKWASGSLKCLEVLRIKHCYKLRDLQLSNLQKLDRIEMVDSNPKAETSIKLSTMEYRLAPTDFDFHYSWNHDQILET